MPSEPVARTLPSLRLWPALTLLALQWGLAFLPKLFAEPPMAVFMAAFLGPVLCVILIFVWWVAGSRATRREKLVGFGGVVVLLVATAFFLHPTMRDYPVLSMVLPWAGTAFVAGLVGSKWLPRLSRTTVALAAVALSCAFWCLMRMDGVWGDFQSQRAWRWEPTTEDRYLAGRDAAATATGLPTTVPPADWAGFRGSDRDSVVRGVALAEDWESEAPRMLWSRPIGPGWSSFAVAGRRLFTQEQRGEFEAVVAYDTETGGEIWAREYRSRFFESLGGAGPRATPTLADGMLFALGAEGLLHRLDPATGKVVWQADLREDADREPPTWGFSSSPLVVAGVVVVHAGGEGDRGTIAYDVEDGRIRWGVPAGGHSYSSPQLLEVADRKVVAQVCDAALTLIDPASGKVVGKHDWPHNNYRVLQPLSVGRSSLLMTSDFEGTRRVDFSDSGASLTTEPLWTSRSMKSGFNDYVAHDGVLYGFDPNILAAVDLETGERRWKGGRYGNGQVLLLPDAGQLLVLSEKGEVVLLRTNPDKLEELARLQAIEGKTWNHPALVGDRLYVRNAEEMAALAMPVRNGSS